MYEINYKPDGETVSYKICTSLKSIAAITGSNTLLIKTHGSNRILLLLQQPFNKISDSSVSPVMVSNIM